jgi:hypothetical protein
MKMIGIDDKVQEHKDWLEEVRNGKFIRREANQLHLQLNHPQNLERIRQQYQEWQLQIHKPLGELRTMKENIHITCQRLKGSNPWLSKSLNTDNKLIQTLIQSIRNNLPKSIHDSLFVERDQQLLVFLAEEFYGPNNSSNYINDRNYYILQDRFHRGVLKEELVSVGNSDQLKHCDSLKIIEKAINFLRRKFDRFKYKSPNH